MSEQADDFFIVANANLKMLEAEVKKLIGEGWDLHGGLCSAVGNAPNAIPIFCQAMVKVKRGAPEAPKGNIPLRHKHSVYKQLIS